MSFLENSMYEECGYPNRKEYLKGLAMEYDVPTDVVFSLASVLGESEDFDGLVTELQDINYYNEFDCDVFYC